MSSRIKPEKMSISKTQQEALSRILDLVERSTKAGIEREGHAEASKHMVALGMLARDLQILAPLTGRRVIACRPGSESHP